MMKFFSFFADIAGAATANEEAPHDLREVNSIEDSIGFFHNLSLRASDWFQREQNHLLSMLLGVAITIVAAFIVHWVSKNILLRLAQRTPTRLDEAVIKRLSAPLSMLVLLIGFSACNQLVDFPGTMDQWLAKIYYAGFILVVLWGIFRVISIFDLYFRERVVNSERQLNDLLIDLISRTIKVTVWVMAVIFIAQNLFNLNVTALVTGAGVAGLAIAFAAQNTISNLFGAISIISDKTFKVGDRIKVNETHGVVEAVGFRSTRLRSLDGTLWNVPNRIAADSTIENITERPNIKYAFSLGLVYDTTPEQMRRALDILGGILNHYRGFDLEKQPPLFFFTDYKAYSLDISVILWFQTQDFVEFCRMKQEINLAILEQFNAAGLSFAFPTSTNYIINQGE